MRRPTHGRLELFGQELRLRWIAGAEDHLKALARKSFGRRQPHTQASADAEKSLHAVHSFNVIENWP
jgi:hypothetical protein